MPVENGESVLSSLPDPDAPPPPKQPTWPTLRIQNPTMVGRRTRMWLDDKEISNWVYRYQLEADIKSANTLRLELYIGAVEIDQPVVPIVELDRSLQAALIAQGWSPPVDD